MSGTSTAHRCGTIIGVIGLLLLWSPVTALAFKPQSHLDNTLGALEGAGFSYEQAWMLTFFNIEVDIATEVPGAICQGVLRWPTQSRVCPWAGRLYGPGYDPCAPGAFFDDWVNNCLPFHSPGTISAYGLPAVRQLWRYPSIAGAMHPVPGERCYDWLKRFGQMLHGIQDFYAHSNWIEVFHEGLGFDFDDIPSWTSFQKAQRGEQLNLILLKHAGGNRAQAASYYNILSQNLILVNHDVFNKDSSWLINACYNYGSRSFHEDDHGHDVVDYHRAAHRIAGAETYQLGLQMRHNVANHPKLGPAAWSKLFNCVAEMAKYDGVSVEEELETYQDAVWRVKTYGRYLGLWF